MIRAPLRGAAKSRTNATNFMVKCRQVVKRSELHHCWNLHFLFFFLFFLFCLERTFAAVSLFVSGLRTGPTGPIGHPEKQVSRDVALVALPQNLYKASFEGFRVCFVLHLEQVRHDHAGFAGRLERSKSVPNGFIHVHSLEREASCGSEHLDL